MLFEDYREFIKKAKEDYKKIGYIECPAFNGEKVYFNQKGFKHLIMKRGKYRTHKQQIRRLSLIPHIVSILSLGKKIDSYRNLFGIDFWSLSKVINGFLIIVVIRQNKKDMPKYFLSLMNKRLSKNAKAPEGTS